MVITTYDSEFDASIELAASSTTFQSVFIESISVLDAANRTALGCLMDSHAECDSTVQ